MDKFINWLETSFSPRMNKINNNVWIVTVKDSIMQTLPFIFLGSVFSMLAILNEFIPGLPNFWVPFGWTMGMVSLFISFLIPFNLMEKKRLRKQRIIAGMSGIVSFLIVVSPQVIADETIGFQHDALGAGGMFVAMFTGIFSGFIMALFGKFSFFNEESVIPDFVRSWFDSMLPVGIVVLISWIAVDLAGLDINGLISNIFMPLQHIVNTPLGFVVMCLLFCFLYSLGISTWVLTPVFNPILLQLTVANATGAAQNVVSNTLIYSTYLWIGGIGCTLPLVLMMMCSKSKKLKTLGIASFPPSIFNINEPVVFGAIAWNPYLMIPMWLQGIVLPLLIWLFTKVIPLGPIPTMQFEMWYCPFPISTWITTGSFMGIMLMAIVFIVAGLIWFPFFKAYEKMEVDKEAEPAAASK